MTALDAIGPYEVLQRIPSMTVRSSPPDRATKRTENGSLQMVADTRSTTARARVVLVPGGAGEVADARRRHRVLAVVARRDETSPYTTSVCTGSLVLAAAGLLEGVRRDHALDGDGASRRIGRDPGRPNAWSRNGKIVTAAGVSSGIDMALVLAARLAGDDVAQAIQLSIEYDPHRRSRRIAVERSRPPRRAAARGQPVRPVRALLHQA